MKGTKTRTVNSLGMFDLFKGIGMATVSFVHTAEANAIDLGRGLSVTSFLLFIYRAAQAVGGQMRPAAAAGHPAPLPLHGAGHGRAASAFAPPFLRLLDGRRRSEREGPGRLSAGPSPHLHLFWDEHFLLRTHVVSADHGGRLVHP